MLSLEGAMSVEKILKAAEKRVDEVEICMGKGHALSADLKRKQIEIVQYQRDPDLLSEQ